MQLRASEWRYAHEASRVARGAVALLAVRLLFATVADCWFDEGHMTIMAIAEMNLTPEEVAQFEGFLLLFRDDFKGSTSIINSGVWADHIRCSERTYPCQGLPRLGAFQTFTPLHWQTRLNNPQGVAVDDDSLSLPYDHQGGVVQMKKLIGALKAQSPHRAPKASQCQHHPKDRINPGSSTWEEGLEAMIFYRRHRQEQTSTREGMQDVSEGGQKGSWLDSSKTRSFYNVFLRLLFHVYGDLHQPLHATRTYLRGFDEGDKGGTLLTLLYPTSWRKPNYNLHQLWDAAGGELTRVWPLLTDEDARQTARGLTAKYSHSSFTEEELWFDAEDFDHVAQESFQIGKELYEKLLDFATFSAEQLPVKVTDEYLLYARSAGERRLVQAGYRMGRLLKWLIQYLPITPEDCLTPIARLKEQRIRFEVSQTL